MPDVEERRGEASAKGVRILPMWAIRIDYRIWRLLTFTWMALLFFLSSQSSLPSPTLFSGQDKLGHMISFGILGFLASRSISPSREELSLRDILVVTLLVTGYGLIDELHQYFVAGRESSIWDVAADSTGGLLAAVIFRRR